jgi:transposase
VAPSANLDDLVRELAEIRRELTLLREENAKLREALQRAQRAGKRQASPFSKGEPKNEPKTPGRKPGSDYGKKGHKKVPVKVDEVVDVPLPSTCACGGALVAERVAAQYQTEIPKIEPWMTRFDVHVGCCRRCGRRAQGRHPRQTSDALGAAASQLGPRAQALAVHFQKELGVSFGKAQALMSSVFGLEVTRGGLAQAVLRVADRLDPTHREIVASLPRAPVISPDETGWRVGGRSAWQWVFEAVDRVVYAVLPGRGFEDATLVLPADYSGTLVRDGWGPYRSYVEATHQTCLNHLLVRCRELLTVAVRGAARLPHLVRKLLKDALALRDRRDAGALGERGLRSLAGKLNARLEKLLTWRPTDDENRKLLGHLRREQQLGAVLGFLTRPGTPATNHRAEQAIRPAVVNRKTCGGNRTWSGAIAQGVLTTVLGTVRRQHGDPLDVIRRALCAPEPTVIDIFATTPTV